MKFFYYSLVGRCPKGFPLGIVWNPLVPMRGIFFSWEIVWKKNLTLDQLKRRGWCLPRRCYLCIGEEESANAANHILPHCSKATSLWHLILALFIVQWVNVSLNQGCPSQLARILCWEEKKEGVKSKSFMLILDPLEGEKSKSL